MKTLLFAITILLLPALSFAELSQETRKEHFNLEKKRLGVHGYDPVSYFSNKPLKGSSKLSTVYQGVEYRFATAENLAAFNTNPAKYEPQYGGWCAWAMREGGKTDIDPKSYKTVDGKLFLFYKGLFGDTLKSWNKRSTKNGEQNLIQQANQGWSGFVG